ncbi:hypothetical protein [Bacillus solimangrovi]|uniref:hypothetical protein n=1 Tax=Bacillus solimangrovi TaxID=1305675 RepID=UPI001112DD07|nr:hypothetical protein [Bacillus solimangrovi]
MHIQKRNWLGHINTYSFFCSLICVGIFFFITSKGFDSNISIGSIEVNPLTILLISSTLTLLFAVIGLGGVKNFRTMVMSILTISLTLLLMLVATSLYWFGRFIDSV